MPNDAELLDIINIYVFERYPAEKARCVKCGAHQHKNGFTAVLASGQRVLLGSTCGARLFQESWTEAEKRIEERAERQYELKRLDRFSVIWAPLERGLLSWKDFLEQVSGRRAAFDNHLGELASRIREAVLRNAGALTIFRNVEAKSARDAGMKGPLGAHQEVIVGQVLGGGLFATVDPAKSVTRALDALDSFKEPIGESDNYTVKMLKDRRRTFERALEDVEAAAKTHAAAEEFFTVPNFTEMLRWANEHGATQSRYVIDAHNVVRAEGRQGGIQISMPPPLDASILDLFADYRRAD